MTRNQKIVLGILGVASGIGFVVLFPRIRKMFTQPTVRAGGRAISTHDASLVPAWLRPTDNRQIIKFDTPGEGMVIDVSATPPVVDYDPLAYNYAD